MERGFYNADTGSYFQEIADPQAGHIASRPSGYVEVPLKPSRDHEYDPDSGTWVESPPDAAELRNRMPALRPLNFKLALIANNIDPGEINAYIAAISDPVDRMRAEATWQEAASIERTHSLVAAFAAHKGLSDEQVDSMWNAAVLAQQSG